MRRKYDPLTAGARRPLIYWAAVQLPEVRLVRSRFVACWIKKVSLRCRMIYQQVFMCKNRVFGQFRDTDFCSLLSKPSLEWLRRA